MMILELNRRINIDAIIFIQDNINIDNMENKRIFYGLITGIIIIFIIGVAQINFLQNKVTELERSIIEMDQTIEFRDDTIQGMSNQIDDMEATIDQLDSNFVQSQENSSRLYAQLKTVNATLEELGGDTALLDKAIYIIGQGDIENLLREYSDVLVKYNDLQDKYDKLLQSYNALLEQQEN